MYQLGLVSISFRDLSPEEIINSAKNSGLKWIEWGSDVHAPCNNSERLANIAKCQLEANIGCSSYGTYFTIGIDELDVLENHILAAKMLGTSVLRLWCGDKGSKEYEQKDLLKVYGECKKAATLAESHGVVLCMECHNNTLTDTKESALALMETVNSSAFRMYWQPNQHCSEAENMEYLTKLKPYIYHLHVFNWKGDKRYSLSSAIEMWKRYLSCLEGERMLLLEFMPDDRIESLHKEADALRQIVRKGGCK